MAIAAWVAGAVVLELWITGAVVSERGWRIWPWIPCPRCGGRGRWRTGNPRNRVTRREYTHVYCSVCKGIGVRMRWRVGGRSK